jgi:hypothetical protein
LPVLPLMPGTRNDTPYFLVAIAVIVIAVVFIVIAKKYRRLRKPLLVVAVVTLALVIGAYAFWSNEASIDYWLMTDLTYPVGENHLDVTCENVGHLAGTINLKLQFTNAQFISTTSSSYQQVDSQTVAFAFTPQPGEMQSATVYFNIGAGVTDFYLYLSAEDGLFTKYHSGVSQVSYQRTGAVFNQRIQTAAP